MTIRHHMRAAGTTATIFVLAIALVGCGSTGGNNESGPARGPIGGGGVTKPDTGAADGTTSTGDDPQSTFAVDVDTASYGYARRQILAGRLPSPSTVRPEEFVNAFG